MLSNDSNNLIPSSGQTIQFRHDLKTSGGIDDRNFYGKPVNLEPCAGMDNTCVEPRFYKMMDVMIDGSNTTGGLGSITTEIKDPRHGYFLCHRLIILSDDIIFGMPPHFLVLMFFGLL